jgi:hypothetical protein
LGRVTDEDDEVGVEAALECLFDSEGRKKEFRTDIV